MAWHIQMDSYQDFQCSEGLFQILHPLSSIHHFRLENIILVVGLRHFLVSILFAFFPIVIVLYTEIRT